MFQPSDYSASRDVQPANTNNAATIDGLIEALASDDGVAQGAARSALVRQGSRAVPALCSALVATNPDVRWEAARALREIGDPEAAPSLERALEDDSFDVRWIAAEGLITLGQNGLRSLLEDLVQRPPSARLLEGAHHVLKALDGADRLPAEVQPVLAALEGFEPDLTVPPAAQSALWAMDRGEEVGDSIEPSVDCEQGSYN